MLDTSGNAVPASQQANFVKVLERNLLREQEEGQISPEMAFLVNGVRLFGFDPDEGYMTDGPKDYGFDYLDITNESCTIFQSKSLNYANGIDTTAQIAPSYLDDVRQIAEVLKHSIRHPLIATSNYSKRSRRCETRSHGGL
jgi:hypothetical protein